MSQESRSSFDIEPSMPDMTREGEKYIARIDILPETFQLAKPFRIARQEFHSISFVNIQLTDREGNIGFGSAAPEQGVTEETVADAMLAVQSKLATDFFDKPLETVDAYFEKIKAEFDGLPTVQAAVQEALYNLIAKRHGVSLQEMFGDSKKQVDVMISIGINDDTEALLRDIDSRIHEGYQIVKLKVGLDVQKDLLMIQKVREHIPQDIKIILDANQGYSREDAKKFIEEASQYNITLIEQPVKQDDREGLKDLTALHLIPIFADEAVHTAEDAEFLLKNDYVDGVNIKLMKCGGPGEFLRIHDIAKKLGKQIMIGCMFESQISITTGAALALGCGVDFADLDSGYIDFPDEPFKGGARVEHGKISIPGPLRYEP